MQAQIAQVLDADIVYGRAGKRRRRRDVCALVAVSAGAGKAAALEIIGYLGVLWRPEIFRV